MAGQNCGPSVEVMHTLKLHNQMMMMTDVGRLVGQTVGPSIGPSALFFSHRFLSITGYFQIQADSVICMIPWLIPWI